MTEYARLVLSVDSTQAVNASKNLNTLGQSSRATEKSIGGLAATARSLAGPLAAFLSVRAVIRASDEYGQMASRIRMATGSAEEYTKVQDRLLQTANETYRPLQEAQEVYIRTADAIRSLGYDTDAALDITDSFSFLLVTNAASADRASSAINAYSKAIQTGKVDSETWQSILAATPTVVDDIARATGTSAEEIRKLGITGKLSLEALNEALRQSRDRNRELAAEMETSVQDASTQLSNAFTVFVGKVNESSGASSVLTSSIGELAAKLQDPETIKNAQELAGAIVRGFTAATSAIQGTIDVTRFMAESLAAAIHGPSLDDLPRLEDEINSVTQKAANLAEELSRHRLNRLNPFQSTEDLEADYKKMLDRLEFLKSAREEALRRPPLKPGSDDGSAGSGDGKPSIVKPTNDELTASQKAIQAMEKQLELAKLTGEARARLQAIQKLGVDATEAERAEAEKLAAQIYKLEEAHRSAGKAGNDAARDLARNYRSTADSLNQQIALYGQTTEVARLRYEMESGSLQGLASKQVDYLQGLARELDAKRDLTEQEQLRITLLRESGQLRAANDAQFELEYAAKILEYEKAGNVEAAQRLETLRRIREIQMNADQAPGTVEGVSKAPKSSIISPEIGGPSSEMMRLEQESIALDLWRETELEKQRAFREAKAIDDATFQERERNIFQQHQDQLAQIEASRQQVQLAAGESFFGSMASITKQFAGEQSGLYKAMFAIQKAAAIAQSIIAIQQGIAMAAANPWPVNLGAMASVAAATAGLVSNIASVSLDGMAHDGIDSVPREGTWLLDKGERVVDRRTNADLKEYLAQGGGNGGGGQQITQHIAVNGNPDDKTLMLIQQAAADGARKGYQMVTNDLASGRGQVSKGLQGGYAVKRRKT